MKPKYMKCMRATDALSRHDEENTINLFIAQASETCHGQSIINDVTIRLIR